MAKALYVAEEHAVQSSNRFFRNRCGDRLNPGSTGHNKKRIGIINHLLLAPEITADPKHMAGLVDDYGAGDLKPCRCERLLHLPNLFLSACLTDSCAFGATHDKYRT